MFCCTAFWDSSWGSAGCLCRDPRLAELGLAVIIEFPRSSLGLDRFHLQVGSTLPERPALEPRRCGTSVWPFGRAVFDAFPKVWQDRRTLRPEAGHLGPSSRVQGGRHGQALAETAGRRGPVPTHGYLL